MGSLIRLDAAMAAEARAWLDGHSLSEPDLGRFRSLASLLARARREGEANGLQAACDHRASSAAHQQSLEENGRSDRHPPSAYLAYDLTLLHEKLRALRAPAPEKETETEGDHK